MNSSSHRDPFFSSGNALRSLRTIFSSGKVARIATAYFEPSGWRLLRDLLINQEIRLLVGRPEGAEEKVKGILDEILESLRKDNHAQRTRSLMALRAALVAGRLKLSLSSYASEESLSFRYLYHHGKVYISDRREMLLTSANFSAQGLQFSREAGLTIDDSETVNFFVHIFDRYYEEGTDLTGELLALLDRWLGIHPPFHVYIRSLLEYYGLPEMETPGQLPEPAAYQRPVISAILRNLEDWGGSFLVASTGLGKTIIAAHVAARLRLSGEADSALVFCPSGLRRMWSRTLRAARISERVFSYYSLTVEDWKRFRSVEPLEEELKGVDHRTLIILDESHHLRNESIPGEVVRLRNRRIREAVERGARVLLMTATPYSRGVKDINAQLRILPKVETKEGLFVRSTHWSLESTTELSEIPAAVVLTSPTVVSHFSLRDDAGNRYVHFSGDRRMFFPHTIHVRSIPYENPLDPILIELLRRSLLYRRDSAEEGMLFASSGRRDPLLEARVIHQFCSSAGEALRVCDRLSKEGGFEKIRFQRQDELESYLEEKREFLERFRSRVEGQSERIETEDRKIEAVGDILKRHPGEKVVLFCHYHETARYVAGQLSLRHPGRVVKHTLDAEGDQLDDLLREFAPMANRSVLDEEGSAEGEEVPQSSMDTLVATGSISEGFNLQDAAVLINFDLPWTVLILAQRMGRILRPWPEPREVTIYNLIPSTMESPELEELYLARNWKERLMKRSQEQSSFASIPVFLEQEREESFDMIRLGRVLDLYKDQSLNLEEALEFVESADHFSSSSFLDDLADLSADEVREIRKIPPGFRSFARDPERGRFLYLLLTWKGRNYPALFDSSGDPIPSSSVDMIMKKIRCTRDMSTLSRSEEEMDRDDLILSRARDNWARSKDLDPVEVDVVCSLEFV